MAAEQRVYRYSSPSTFTYSDEGLEVTTGHINAKLCAMMIRRIKTIRTLKMICLSFSRKAKVMFNESLNEVTNLTKLDLHSEHHNLLDLDVILKLITANQKLVHITYGGFYVGRICECAAALPELRSLSLHFRPNSMAQDMNGLCYLISNTSSLTSLQYFNELGPVMNVLLNSMAHNSTITHLDLWRKGLTEDHAEALGFMIRTNSTLKYLNLRLSSLGDLAAGVIGEALKINSTLEYLNLTECQITNATLLAAGLAVNQGLTYLELGSKLTFRPGCLLRALRTNTSLQHLSLKQNLTIDEFEDLKAMLEVNTTLINLQITWDSDVGDAGFDLLASGLKHNTSLRQMIVGYFNRNLTVCPESLIDALTHNTALDTFGSTNTFPIIRNITRRNEHNNEVRNKSLLDRCLAAV